MTNKRSWLIRHCAPFLILSFLSTPFAYSKSLQSLDLEHGCERVPATPDAAGLEKGDLRTAKASSFAGSASVSTNENNTLSARDYLADVAPDGLYRWPTNKLPVKVFFQTSNKVPYFRAKFSAILKGCFDEWVEASNGKLGWVETADADAADIVVQWSDKAIERPEGTEGGRTKTYAQLNTATNMGTIRKAEITLTTRLPEREFTDDELRKAYLHEVGHAFGIAGHSPNRDDIMYFAVSKRNSPHLADRDRATINHLYSEYERLNAVVGSGLPAGKRVRS